MFLFHLTQGQNQKVADSLVLLLSNTSTSDSTYFSLLEEVAYQQRKPAQKLYYSNLLVQESQAQGEQFWTTRGLILNGHAYRLLGDFDEALQRYLSALGIAEEQEFEKLEAGAHSSLGDLYSLSERHEQSIEHYNLAFAIFKNLGDSVNMGTTLLNTGDEYLNAERLDSALAFFQRSKVIFDKIDLAIGKAYNLGNIGLVMARQGNYTQAEENMNEAIAILETLGDKYPIAVYQISLADIYTNRGEYNRALSLAESSLAIGVEEGLKEQIRDASLKLSDIHLLSGDTNKAFTYLKQHNVYRDSINNEETIRKMADLRTEYEVAKKQAEVDLLDQQAKLNRIVAWSAIFIIGLLMMLILALFKINRIKDRAVRIVRQRRRVIAAQRNRLDEVNKTKDRFFSIISHDIRGPISNFQGISGLINLLAESKDEEGLRQLGKMMEGSAKEISGLLDNLLEWAQSQEGKIPYNPEQVYLKELCQSGISIMSNMASGKQIALASALDKEVSIVADRNSVSTIIRNLLSNAIKFTNEGGRVELQVEEEDGQGVIIVKDNGIGIPADKLNDLFSFKGKRSRGGTKGEKGVGLGLSLVHEFVELNHGKIEVESEEGVGTTFRVYFPKKYPELAKL